MVFTWKNVAFTLNPFAVMKWYDCLPIQLPFELPVQIPVQLLPGLELNLLAQNVIILEFELSRMQMKQPLVQMAVGISGFEELVFAFLFTIGKLNFVTYLLTNLLFYNCCITNTGY